MAISDYCSSAVTRGHRYILYNVEIRYSHRRRDYSPVTFGNIDEYFSFGAFFEQFYSAAFDVAEAKWRSRLFYYLRTK